jgi:hypothetical protein
MDTYPPTVAGVTETGSGTETMQVLASLATMYQRKPSAVVAMLSRMARLLTPTEPPAEPQASGSQLLQSQAVPAPLSQLPGPGL